MARPLPAARAAQLALARPRGEDPPRAAEELDVVVARARASRPSAGSAWARPAGRTASSGGSAPWASRRRWPSSRRCPPGRCSGSRTGTRARSGSSCRRSVSRCPRKTTCWSLLPRARRLTTIWSSGLVDVQRTRSEAARLVTPTFESAGAVASYLSVERRGRDVAGLVAAAAGRRRRVGPRSRR